jgi:hypothetical protein
MIHLKWIQGTFADKCCNVIVINRHSCRWLFCLCWLLVTFNKIFFSLLLVQKVAFFFVASHFNTMILISLCEILKLLMSFQFFLYCHGVRISKHIKCMCQLGMLKTQYQSKNGHFLLQPISEVNVAWAYLLTQIGFDTNWKLYFIQNKVYKWF